MNREPGIYHDLDAADYHAGDELSSSAIKAALHSPQRYAFEYRDGNGRADKPAFIKGRIVHSATLEAEKFAAQYHVADCQTRAAKAFKEAAANNPGKEIITTPEFESAQAIADAVWSDEIAASLLVGSDCETSLYWSESGRAARARTDVWRRIANSHVADLKTCADASPEGFTRAVFRYGYHISAAWYIRGIKALTGHAPKEWYWVAVEKEPPYLVQVYRADEDTLWIGDAKVDEALALIDECERTNQWPAFRRGIVTITPPAWAGIDEGELEGATESA